MAELVEELHDALSPSAAERWLHCNGSVEANRGDTRTNAFADEGTAAHKLLELALSLDREAHYYIGKPIYKHYKVTEDMADAVALAIDYQRSYLARNPKAKLYLEQRVDPHNTLKCDKRLTSGTLDMAMDNAPEELVLIDYKHGAGILVEVEDNKQLLQYALGFFSQYATRPYKQYRLVIIQPRHRHKKGPAREWIITHEQLMAHAAHVRKRLASIRKDPLKREAGYWCKFCAAEGKCRTLAKHAMQKAAMEFGEWDMKKQPINPDELDAEELAHALRAWQLYIEHWGQALYAAALEFVTRGGKLPEFKMVRGRSMRYFTNDKKVASMLLRQFKFSKDEIAPRSMIGVPGVEALFKKRIKIRGRKQDPLPPAIKKLIGRTQAQLHIAHVSDPREAVQRGQEFKGK